jgi:hypothetical protein
LSYCLYALNFSQSFNTDNSVKGHCIYLQLIAVRKDSASVILLPATTWVLTFRRLKHKSRFLRARHPASMRVFLIKFAGLALYIDKLQQGRLKLTHKHPGKVPKECAIDDEDFEDSADDLSDEDAAKLETGLAATAIGLSLLVIKNDGVLKTSFEGKDGGVADWSFEGMNALFGNNVTVSALIQTEPDTPVCLKCAEAAQSGLSVSAVQCISTRSVEPHVPRPIPVILTATCSTGTQT